MLLQRCARGETKGLLRWALLSHDSMLLLLLLPSVWNDEDFLGGKGRRSHVHVITGGWILNFSYLDTSVK